MKLIVALLLAQLSPLFEAPMQPWAVGPVSAATLPASQFSTKESALLLHYLPQYASTLQLSTVPYEIYTEATIASFIANKNDAVFDASLRACMKAFAAGNVARPSAAWDALINAGA